MTMEAGMKYIVSDIHGCFDQYQKLLEKINFSSEDKLYVLGDAVDRGPEPIRLLQDMMKRPNIIFILGNHDFIMYSLLKKLCEIIPGKNHNRHMTAGFFMDYNSWFQDGGWITAKQFTKLDYSEKMHILDYISEASLYEVIKNNGKEYRLVHAGLANFEPGKDLDEYDLYDFLEERTDYTKRYYPEENIFLVTGHTPAVFIKGWEKPEVYRKNGHIAIDCACVAGGQLAAFCVETEKVIYVKGKA